MSSYLAGPVLYGPACGFNTTECQKACRNNVSIVQENFLYLNRQKPSNRTKILNRPINRDVKVHGVPKSTESFSEDFSASARRRKYPELYSSSSTTGSNVSQSSPSETRTNHVDTAIVGNEGVPENDEVEQGLHQQSGEIRELNGKVYKKPEVLAPAGGWLQLKAAVENGADAVYFGVDELNARIRAENFGVGDLGKVMEYLHERGLKGYLTLNTLIFDDELLQMGRIAQEAAVAGVDAVIVQDIGAVAVIKAVAPGLEIHGSTQMSITDPYGAAFAGKLGLTRVVVGRELSIKDLATFQNTSKNNLTLKVPEIETFVHGALCVSYSGQCFSSEAWGGRSANRGQCAQACRLGYGLLVDGALHSMGDIKYLLSPQDLAAIDLIPELIKAGVCSFKIEGRLKGPEYVAMTTKAYRKAVDAAWENFNFSQKNNYSPKYILDSREQQDLHQVFARGQDASHTGLTSGFLLGPRHQQLVRGRAPKHRGVFLGHVLEISLENVTHKKYGDVNVYQKYKGYGRRGYERTDAPKRTPRNRDRKDFKEESNMYLKVCCNVSASLRCGDGIVIDEGNPHIGEIGGLVDSINVLSKQKRKEESVSEVPANTRVQLVIKIVNKKGLREILETTAKKLKAKSNTSERKIFLWKTRDSTLERRLQETYRSVSAAERRRVGIRVEVSCKGIGERMSIRLFDQCNGLYSVAETECVAKLATGTPLTKQDIVKAIGIHLGDDGSLFATHFDFDYCDGLSDSNDREMESDKYGGIFIPASSIKDARRRAVTKLVQQQQMISVIPRGSLPDLEDGLRNVWGRIRENSSQCKNKIQDAAREYNTQSCLENGLLQSTPKLRVLCRTPEQVKAAIGIDWLQDIILDFLEVHGLKGACEMVRLAGKKVTVATPRILKPDEHRLWLFYLKLRPDALLIRSAGLLHQFMELGGRGATIKDFGNESLISIPRLLEGDFSLNASNSVSADVFLNDCGLSSLVLAHDCNADQMADLAISLGPRSRMLEAILHTNLPIFHTEHCVFARFLSDGNSFLDCGHPCENHNVHLRSDNGSDHLVLADMGCRNTVFSASAQSALPYLRSLTRAGYGTFRIELVDQPGKFVGPLLEAYKAAIQKELDIISQRYDAQPLAKEFMTMRSMDMGKEDWNGTNLEDHIETWNWLQQLPNAYGNVQGVELGSLEVRSEIEKASMKPTAASLKANPSSFKISG